jgi:hypothetical protein
VEMWVLGRETAMATGTAADPDGCSNRGTLAALGFPVKGRFAFCRNHGAFSLIALCQVSTFACTSEKSRQNT